MFFGVEPNLAIGTSQTSNGVNIGFRTWIFVHFSVRYVPRIRLVRVSSLDQLFATIVQSYMIRILLNNFNFGQNIVRYLSFGVSLKIIKNRQIIFKCVYYIFIVIIQKIWYIINTICILRVQARDIIYLVFNNILRYFL